MKKALAILGDAWHAPAPLNLALVKKLQKEYDVDTVINYDVPFDHFSEYDLIVISKYGLDDVKLYSKHVEPYNKDFWMTEEQENLFVQYVENGGKLFIHHDGFDFYRKGGGINTLAKAYFINHPPIGKITVSPVEGFDEFNKGIEPYEIADEEYNLEMDETQTNIFLTSYSQRSGRSVQGWYHDFGKGKVAVFIPGHELNVLIHPMVSQGIENVINWLAD
jgi:type 1 glutamine amidotransferase